MPATPHHDKTRHELRQSTRTMITRKYDHYKRQAIAPYYLLEHGGMTIQNHEQLCP
jgi:predicted YcjX-like family ATPase